MHIELPEDVASEEVDASPHPRVRQRRPIADPVAIDRAAALIRDARNPILIVSAGANRKRVGRELGAFVERTGIYAVGTQMGMGVLPDDHPRSLLNLGIHKRDYVHAAIDTADLVITLGYDIVEYPPSVWNERRDKTILHIDFRIAEPDEFYDPALEVVGDISSSLAALARSLGETRFDDERLAALRKHLRERLRGPDHEESYPAKPQLIVQRVRKVMGRLDIVCLDNGIYKLWFARMYPAYAENTVLLDNALATMGAGLASAMAAKLVHPERRVLAICGDGGFMMNSQGPRDGGSSRARPRRAPGAGRRLWVHPLEAGRFRFRGPRHDVRQP